MYILFNAMKNLLRNRGRNILIACVTLAIIVSSVVTLTISNAASKIIEDVRLDIGSRVEISKDLFKLHSSGAGASGLERVRIKDYIEYSKSDYLKKTIFNVEMTAWSDTFLGVGDPDKGARQYESQDGSGAVSNAPTMRVEGYSEPDLIMEFVDGDRTIFAGGRMFEADNECVISEEIANLNNISVGDTIHIQSVLPADNPKKFALTVVGIYSDKTEEFTNPWIDLQIQMGYALSDENRRNEVLTSYETVMAANWESDYGLTMKTEYFLKDPDDLAKFEKEVRSKGLPASIDVKINQTDYDAVAGPMRGMKNAVTTFAVVIIILGAIALMLVSFLAIRERKYEVGVLRAMGMEKRKIALGVFAEAVMITAICLVIGLGFGNLGAQGIANGLLAGQITAAVAKQADEAAGGGKYLMAGGQSQTSIEVSKYKPVSDIQVNLGADTLTQIIILALALAAVSSVVGIIIITKYEPLKILRERN